jgi:Arc/MetJ-type ribon-helix-helix transcriptional regulator
MAKSSTHLKRGRPKTLSGVVQNVNLHIESEVCERIDALVGRGKFKNRSDFIRKALQIALAKNPIEKAP